MLLHEFEQRTDFFPSSELYAVIERHYNSFDGDKDEFCKAYKENTNGLAEAIQKEATMENINAQRQIAEQLRAADEKIKKLEADLEREQEWRLFEDTDNVSQGEYEKLASAGDTKILSDDEAKDLLYEWYGFAREKITIHHTVPIYEVNRHRRMRKVGEHDRAPAYNATDWNYIRFDCGCMSYELYNDNLRPFLH